MQHPTESLIRWFAEIGVSDTATVGGKGANLGELAHASLPVPPGFVITAQAYLAAMDAAGVRKELREQSRSVNVDDATELADAARRLRALVHKAGMPEALRDQVIASAERRLLLDAARTAS